MLRQKSKNRIKIIAALLLSFVVCPLYSICQQHNFVLKVHFDDPSVKTLFTGEAYYYKLKPYHVAKIKSDSANVHNKTYLYEGTILYPTAIRLFPLNAVKMNKLIFIDTGFQEISIIQKDSSFIVKSNTAIEKEHRKFLNEMGVKTIDDKINGKNLLSYVQKNSNSYVALFAVINQAFKYPYLPIFEKINDAFDEKIKQTKAFQYYLSLYSHKPIRANDSDFLGTSMDGKRVTLSELKGKGFILLDFWASWCRPCRQMMPHLKGLYQKYNPKGFQIISLSFDQDSIEWRKAVKEEGIQSWINLFTGNYYSVKNSPNRLSIKYNIKEFPTTILINKQGAAIGRYVGYSKETSKSGLDKKLSEIFK